MNQERLDRLFQYKDTIYDDISIDKQKILEDIYKDPDIFEVLKNKDLIDKCAPPEDYYMVNIFPFLKIPGTQSTVNNYLCFEINDTQDIERNNAFIVKQVVFRTASHEKDVQTPYGICRQDLLALLIKERFQWSNVLGLQLKVTYDSGKIAENGYYYRQIVFTQTMVNSLQESQMKNRLDGLGRDYYLRKQSTVF